MLDECFLDFTGQEERSLIQKIKDYKNLFILKSFTKMYAMPGIRRGPAVYLISLLYLLLGFLPRKGHNGLRVDGELQTLIGLGHRGIYLQTLWS